ncbi:MAG: VWA domain-containing protein [Blastocatellia bacterium]
MLAIVASLGRVEGRKAVVLFSEGIAVDATTSPWFRDLIREARRADVIFYTIDSGGLRTTSPVTQQASAVNALASNRADSALGGGEDTSGRPMSFDAEDNVTNMYGSPTSTLNPLAEQTGGFLIDQTNDLVPGLSRIGEDIRSYYVLTYAPLNQHYDGKFREISVKVSRPGVHVEARKGYYAMRKPAEMQVPDWESPAIAVLKSGRNENSFPIRARVFSFPSDENSGLLPVLVEVPGSGVTLSVDKAANTFKSDFSIVAVVKDLSDQIVAKVGNHYQVSGPLEKLEAAKHGDFRFYREVDLPPGLYFVEAVAYDTATGKSSIRGASIDVPYYGGADHLRVSSLVLVRNAEPASEATGQDYNLLRYGQAIVYPNMGEPLSKAGNKELAFYIDVYPGKSGASPRKLSVEVLQNDRVVSRGTPALPAPDATGQIQYSGAVPLEAFKPGRYSLRVTVSEGRDLVSRSTGFTVQP